jgi:hypothetical protein
MLMIIEAANAHHEESNPYAPVLDIVTYDLSTITEFGSPEAFLDEIAQLKQYALPPLTRKTKSDILSKTRSEA